MERSIKVVPPFNKHISSPKKDHVVGEMGLAFSLDHQI
jgi:hypothetical protein